MKEDTSDSPQTNAKELNIAKKRASSSSTSQSAFQKNVKKKKLLEQQVHDKFCWLCHKESKNCFVKCQVCPRIYHIKCLGHECSCTDMWVCLECEDTVQNENVDTRSKAMKMVTVDQLCSLLKFAINRMKHQADEAFLKPVSSELFPEYGSYVNNPMDLNTLEKNIRRKMYGCTQSFLADVKWILHNCVVFNGYQHRLTVGAKAVLKICKQEMDEIEVCPDCYLSSYTQRENWFCEPCRTPHILVWAKLKGFPFWPAKAMRVANGNIDVRFFGAHDRAWIPINQCYLLSADSPTSTKNKKKGNFEQSMEELEVHLKRIKEKFHTFRYASSRMRVDPANFDAQISVFFPHMSDGLCESTSIKQKSADNAPDKCDVIKNCVITPVSTDVNTETKNDPLPTKLVDTEASDRKNSALPSVEVRLAKLDSRKLSDAHYDSRKKLESTIERIKDNAHDKSDEDSGRMDIKSGNKLLDDSTFEVNNSTSFQHGEKCTMIIDHNSVQSVNTEKGFSQSCEVTSTTRASPEICLDNTLNTIQRVSEMSTYEKNENHNDKLCMTDEHVEHVAQNKTIQSEDSTEVKSSESIAVIIQEDSETILDQEIIKSKDVTDGCGEKSLKDSEELNLVLLDSDVIANTSAEIIQRKTLSDCRHDIAHDDQIESRQRVNDMNISNSMQTEPDDDGSNLVKDLNLECINKVSANNLIATVSNDTNAINTTVHHSEQFLSNEKTAKRKENIVNDTLDKQPQAIQAFGDLRIGTPITVINISSPPPQMVPKSLPVLQPKPCIQTTDVATQPTSKGPVCDMTKYSRRVMDFMRGTVEEMVRDMSNSGNLEASLKLMQLEMEKLQWRHQQELAEIKHNTDLILLEMRASMESEKQKAIGEVRHQYEIEKQNAVDEAKKKQWCSNCEKEAIFYCCWNTSYCDYPCQQAHWPQHMTVCAQSHTGLDKHHNLQISTDVSLHGALNMMPQVAKAVKISSPVIKTITPTQQFIESPFTSKLDLTANQKVHGTVNSVCHAFQGGNESEKPGVKLQLPTVSRVTTLNPQYSSTLCPSVQYIPSNAMQVIPQTSALANSATLQVQYVNSVPAALNSLTVPVSRPAFKSIAAATTNQGSSIANAKVGQSLQPRSLHVCQQKNIYRI